MGNASSAEWGNEPASSINYQWQVSSNNSSWSNISGATGSTYSPGNLTATRWYRRRALTVACGISAYSSSVKVTVRSNLNAGSIGSNKTICYNASAGMFGSNNPTGGTGSYTYQWQVSSNGSSWSNISEATSKTYSPGDLTSTRWYRRQVTSGSCGTKASSVVKVTVRSDLNAGTISSNASKTCYGGGMTLSSTGISGGTGSYSYQWQELIYNQGWQKYIWSYF